MQGGTAMSSSDNNHAPPGFTLTFEDNFDGVGQQPNSDSWVYDLGHGDHEGGPGWGWGNGEVQSYEQGSENVQIIDLIARDPSEADTDGVADGVNGALRIVAAKTGNEITSARIRSDIDEIGAHGYYEVRAKLPPESGAWPAIWLLGNVSPDRPWPDTGEIDLVEWSSALGYADNHISSALHFKGTPDQQPSFSNTQFTNGADLSSSVDEWHTYQVWWSPDQIRIGVDGNAENAHLVYSKRPGATNDDWPFDHPMDLIMNIAIGGSMGGAYPDSFEYEMLVDYVRVYQGDWSAAMAGEEAESYVAAAEGVLALASDDYADQTGTDWFPWGSAQYEGLVDGAHTYNNVDYIGIEPAAPIDLSGQDTVHLTIMRTNPDADLIFKLVNVNGDEGRLDIPAAWVEANEWVELTFPKSEFINLNTSEDVYQIVLASTINVGRIERDPLRQGAIYE